MSLFDFGTINTAETDGVELAALLENWRDALNSLHSSATEPSYAVPGMLWLDTSTTNPILKMRGATASVPLGELDFNGNVFRPFIGAVLAGALAAKNSVDTVDIEDAAITSPKLGVGSVLSPALGTDVINETHIDPAADAAIRSLLGLGSAALLDSSAFGALAFLEQVTAGQIASADKTGDGADLVTGALGAGENLAKWDANGNVVDSGVAVSSLSAGGLIASGSWASGSPSSISFGSGTFEAGKDYVICITRSTAGSSLLCRLRDADTGSFLSGGAYDNSIRDFRANGTDNDQSSNNQSSILLPSLQRIEMYLTNPVDNVDFACAAFMGYASLNGAQDATRYVIGSACYLSGSFHSVDGIQFNSLTGDGIINIYER